MRLKGRVSSWRIVEEWKVVDRWWTDEPFERWWRDVDVGGRRLLFWRDREGPWRLAAANALDRVLSH